MSRLLDAQDAVQNRKEASGMMEFADVIAGDAPVPYADEHCGMLAGTDLTETEVGELSDYYALAALAMVAAGMPPRHVIAGIFREGLLVGIEYARRAGLA